MLDQNPFVVKFILLFDLDWQVKFDLGLDLFNCIVERGRLVSRTDARLWVDQRFRFGHFSEESFFLLDFSHGGELHFDRSDLVVKLLVA